jgi:hypothetical protein
VRAIAKLGGKEITAGMHMLDYPHIPIEVTFPAAVARAERFPVITLAKKVGYVMGAGDEVPKSLQQLGCEVTQLGADDLASRNLSDFDAIVTGIRAYNLRADLRANQSRLLNYVQDGGTLVVQYNNAQRRATRSSGASPHRTYPFKIGQARTTVEDAPVSFPIPIIRCCSRPTRSPSAISTVGRRSAGSTTRRNGTRIISLSSSRTIRVTSRNLAARFTRAMERECTSTPPMPGSGSCRRACLGLTEFSPTC